MDLLVLKAFYMGKAIRDGRDFSSDVVMISSAIDQLQKRDSRQDLIRLFFYVLSKSGVLRESKELVDLIEVH